MLKTYKVGDRINARLPRYAGSSEVVTGTIKYITRKYGKHEKRYTVDFENVVDGVKQFYESYLLNIIEEDNQNDNTILEIMQQEKSYIIEVALPFENKHLFIEALDKYGSTISQAFNTKLITSNNLIVEIVHEGEAIDNLNTIHYNITLKTTLNELIKYAMEVLASA